MNIHKITFIIPTIGRDTLIHSVNSLLNQTYTDWDAIIIFDGINSNIDINDERIKIIECDKKGLNINNAGLVRNYGISFAKTYWIAFLDDDDIISNDYIETFYNEIELNKNIDLDVVIFRMKCDNKIIPKIKTDTFYLCDVGISFILKKSIFDSGKIFIPDGAEDFLYLDLLRKNNYKIMISPFVKYFVRTKYYNNCEDNEELGNKVFINIDNQFISLVGYTLYSKIKK